MSTPDPQKRLEELIQAFRDHYAVARGINDDNFDELVDAEEQLQDAFFRYDNALFSNYGVELPFDIYDEEEDDDEEDELPPADEFDDGEEFEVYELDKDDDA